MAKIYNVLIIINNIYDVFYIGIDKIGALFYFKYKISNDFIVEQTTFRIKRDLILYIVLVNCQQCMQIRYKKGKAIRYLFDYATFYMVD